MGEELKTKIEAKKGVVSAAPISDGILAGNLLFTSGQVCLKDGKMIDGSIEEQISQVMKNLKCILEAGGSGFSDVVKTTIYVTDLSIAPKINEIYRTYLSEPFPAREMVCVKELPLGAKLEISMIAIKSKK
ncbi:MAG: Rid family detoxifying hydrolase [Candidatus ainarchaeum sp.]|nr:Rid family detoxifying hydrolase [Candidatus ainarchaeum sp.]